MKNGENISFEQNPSMRLVTRRKFFCVAALSGMGVASLSAHDQIARGTEQPAAIGGAAEQLSASHGDRVAEEIKKEKIRRAMLAGPPAGYGATHPDATNSDPQGRALNRRVEVKVLVNQGLNEG